MKQQNLSPALEPIETLTIPFALDLHYDTQAKVWVGLNRHYDVRSQASELIDAIKATISAVELHIATKRVGVYRERTQPSPVEGRQPKQFQRCDGYGNPDENGAFVQSVSQSAEPAGLVERMQKAYEERFAEPCIHTDAGNLLRMTAALAVARAEIEKDTHYHDPHCNAFRNVPMGEGGCSCFMYRRATEAESKVQQLQQKLDEALADYNDEELHAAVPFDRVPLADRYFRWNNMKQFARQVLASRRARLGRKKELSLQERVEDLLIKNYERPFGESYSPSKDAADIIALVRAEIGEEK